MLKVNDMEIVGLRKDAYTSNNALAVMARIRYDDDGFTDGFTEEVPISVNLDHDENLHASNSLNPGEFYCKSWEEGAEIYDALVKAEWLIPTGTATRTGHVRAPICKIGSKAVVINN